MAIIFVTYQVHDIVTLFFAQTHTPVFIKDTPLMLAYLKVKMNEILKFPNCCSRSYYKEGNG